MLNVWRVRREDLHMPVIPQFVMHRSHVFLPTYAVNPESYSAVAQDSFSSDWHSLSSELQGF